MKSWRTGGINMLGRNPGCDQDAFSSMPAKLLSPTVSAASPSLRMLLSAQAHTDSSFCSEATSRAPRSWILGVSGCVAGAAADWPHWLNGGQ